MPYDTLSMKEYIHGPSMGLSCYVVANYIVPLSLYTRYMYRPPSYLFQTFIMQV